MAKTLNEKKSVALLYFKTFYRDSKILMYLHVVSSVTETRLCLHYRSLCWLLWRLVFFHSSVAGGLTSAL